MTANPLLSYGGLPPFPRIRAEHVEPAVEAVLTENRAAAARITAHASQPTWDDFVETLETLAERLHRAWSPAAHLNAVMNSPELRAAYNACLPKLSEYHTELGQNEKLQRGYQALKSGSEWPSYSAAQRKLVEDALRDFRLTGVDLPPEKKQRFSTLMQELSKLEAKFEENLLDATQGWFKHLPGTQTPGGIPEAALARARHAAKSRQLDGYVFTLDYPSYSAVITHADDRALREEMYNAYVTRASDRGPNAGRWDNSTVIRDILRLRHEAAVLTGFNNYAEYSLADKMARTPEEITAFLTDLLRRSRPAAQREFTELQRYARERDGLRQLAAWDMSYYAEKLREERYAVSQETLRPYFPMQRVRAGLFAVMQQLYGITLQEVPDAEVWHPDVMLYEIHDESGALRGRLYMDLFTRTGKRGGAWMDDALSRRRTPQGVHPPAAYLTCNFPPPVGDTPSLLSHDDVLTFFHEFGHCLQHLLTRVDYPSVAGINGVAWDAVELPSQFHENFAWTREGLALVSGHYRTGEPLPDTLYPKMLAARNFHTGLYMLRQLEFCLFDFRLHAGAAANIDTAFAGRTLAEVRHEASVVPLPEWNRFAHSFSHIFSGGYAAGYYSYLWAEVLAADAYAAFEETGIFNRDTGRRFLDTILGQGGSREAMELFVEFRGRPPTLEAFLRLHGIAA
ncbi:MAG: M3 family metallopeptidase [Gammaproteobacteria bacterium]